jgi:hypothetical protein
MASPQKKNTEKDPRFDDLKVELEEEWTRKDHGRKKPGKRSIEYDFYGDYERF